MLTVLWAAEEARQLEQDYRQIPLGQIHACCLLPSKTLCEGSKKKNKHHTGLYPILNCQ